MFCVDTQVCTKCKQDKKLFDFPRNKKTGTTKTYCRQCQNDILRKYQSKHNLNKKIGKSANKFNP